MKALWKLSLLFLLVATFCVNEVQAFVSVKEIEEEWKNTFVANLSLDTVKEEPEKRAISCFDVREDGMIAIGVSNSSRKTICIYNAAGFFQCGYNFNCDGNFGIEWEGDYLIIYFVRGSIGARLSLSGLIDSVFSIPQSTENTKYWNDVVFSTKRTVQESEYILRNDSGVLDLFASAYSQLIVTNERGQTRTIYDASSRHQLSSGFLLIVIFVFVCVVVVSVIKKTSQAKN